MSTQKVLKMETAMRVTENCIRATAGSPVTMPIEPGDALIDLNINDVRIPLLIDNIATNTVIGLPSLVPPRAIHPQILDIDENSTVHDVFSLIFDNAVLAKSKNL